MKNTIRLASTALVLLVTATMLSAQLPTPSMEMRGLWVTKFRTTVLGNPAAEDALLAYADANDFTYLICTNTFQILDGMCPGMTVETAQLQAFLAKAHNDYGLQISANVGSGATAEKVRAYNECASVAPIERYDMITYECEFYNPTTNGACPDFATYYANLATIRSVCDSTVGTDPEQQLLFEVYIGGEGSTGQFVTSVTESMADSITALADQILLTYYRSDPSKSGGNIFNWTIVRLERLTSAIAASPTRIVLLFKSRDTDGNNMYEYLLAWPGSHFDAVRDPWHSWVEGSAYDASLSPGYIEQFDDGTYPWLTGTQVIGFTWFEHAANLAITDSLALSTPEIGRHFKRLWIR